MTRRTRHRERAASLSARSGTRSPGQIRAGALERGVQRPEDRREAGQGLDQAGPRTCLDRASALCGQFSSTSDSSSKELGKINHIVVIYEENHSFDNLFGGWEGVNGRSNVDRRASATRHAGRPGRRPRTRCLKQNDVNLTSPPLTNDVPATRRTGGSSRATSRTRLHDRRLHQAGGRDVPADPERVRVRQRDRQEQPTGAGAAGRLHPRHGARLLPGAVPARRRQAGPLRDAVATRSGRRWASTTRSAPALQVPAREGPPGLRDRRQLLPGGVRRVVPQPPVADRGRDAGRPDGRHGRRGRGQHPMLDSNGMPVERAAVHADVAPGAATAADRDVRAASATLPAPRNRRSRAATRASTRCSRRSSPSGRVRRRSCRADGADDRRPPDRRGRRLGVVLGWLVERERRRRRPGLHERHGGVRQPRRVLRPERRPGRPERRAGGALAAVPGQPVPVPPPAVQLLRGLRTAARPGERRASPGRGGVQRLVDASSKTATSSDVSFIKPIGEENEHPGYASEPDGSDHLVSTAPSIEGSTCAKDTMVIVTYDEFGGQWDHVPPPGQGNDNGPHDIWGPGTRIPALVVAPHLKGDFVVDSDRARHDVDPRHDRAPVRARPARHPRRGSAGPLERVLGEEAEAVGQ